MNAPKAPDPYATAAAQTASNQQTANYTQGLNMVNQVTPDGSLTYSGVNNGQPGAATATVSLSPEQQQIYKNYTSGQIKEGDIANQQLDKVGGILNSPFDLASASKGYSTDVANTRLNPQWAQQAQQFEQDMANRGIRPGSDAYNQSKMQFDQAKNDAYNQFYINDQGQANTAALANRNQPLNEISALMSGSQVSQPTFQNTPNTQVANTDVAGLVNQAYQNKAANYQSTMGGLFGLAGAGLTAGIKYSDRRLKRDIERIGTHSSGLPLYSYRYVWSDTPETGLMADEVARVRPDAVSTSADGFLMVDYAKV